MSDLLRLAAFTLDPAGGNPAGVWIGDGCLSRPRCSGSPPTSATRRPRSWPRTGPAAGRFRVRYFSPAAEVPFCGHATIASGVALAERSGTGRFLLDANDGLVTGRVGTRRRTGDLRRP